MSTPCVSNHSRTLLEPMSALFWWSAETSSILNFGLASALKSSIAISAAITEPLPPRSEYTPDMSVSTAILTTSPEMFIFAGAAALAGAFSLAWASAAPLAGISSAERVRASNLRFIMVSPPG